MTPSQKHIWSFDRCFLNRLSTKTCVVVCCCRPFGFWGSSSFATADPTDTATTSARAFRFQSDAGRTERWTFWGGRGGRMWRESWAGGGVTGGVLVGIGLFVGWKWKDWMMDSNGKKGCIETGWVSLGGCLVVSILCLFSLVEWARVLKKTLLVFVWWNRLTG